MKLTPRSFFHILLSITIVSSVITLPKQYESQSFRIRIKRQEGYVYDKPNMSFDLPSQSTTKSTEAPTVDRTLVQKIMYNYPAPTGGDKINIGSTSGGTVTSGPTPIYNYQISGNNNNAGVGYNYGSTGSSPVKANVGSSNANSASQITSNFQSTANSGASNTNSGYGNNVPSPALSPSLQGLSVSTSAPMYLPPTTDDGKINSGSSAVSSVSNSGQVAPSVGVPSNNYLPPFGSSNAVSEGKTTTSTQIGNQPNFAGAISVPSTAYLPPLLASPDPTQLPLQVPTTNPQSETTSGIYIPPSNVISHSGHISTPSSGYLPPRFF